MAKAVQKGVVSTGAECKLYRVAETLSNDILKKMNAPAPDPSIPIATPNDLVEADAIIFGCPTRFGMIAAQMKTFLDATGKPILSFSFFFGLGIESLRSVVDERSPCWQICWLLLQYSNARWRPRNDSPYIPDANCSSRNDFCSNWLFVAAFDEHARTSRRISVWSRDLGRHYWFETTLGVGAFDCGASREAYCYYCQHLPTRKAVGKGGLFSQAGHTVLILFLCSPFADVNYDSLHDG